MDRARRRRPRIRRWAVVLSTSALAFIAAGCHPEDSASGGKAEVRDGLERSDRVPDVLLISVDTLRRDHLGAYGYARGTSPHIDRLAERGVVFENAESTSSWTLPAHASLLTGRQPSFHGLLDDGMRLPEDVPTLAEAFRAAGYHSLAVVSHVYVSTAFGLDRGFARFDDSLLSDGTRDPDAREIADRFLSLIDEAPEGPLFSFIHFFDPHWPYEPPPEVLDRFADPSYAGSIDGTVQSLLPFFYASNAMPEPDRRRMIDLYDAEVAAMDAEIGRILEALRARGRLDRTIVVFTADHGEELKDHGQLGHGKTLFEEVTSVPLVIAGPAGMPPGTRREDLASLVDVAPTLADLAGIPAPAGAAGRSLRSGPDPERPVVAESIRFGIEMRSVRIGSHKLIHWAFGDRRAWYDLHADPGEESPLAQDPSGGALTRVLEEYAARADHGWHVKLLETRREVMRVRGSIRTSGRFVAPRSYYSSGVGGTAVKIHDLAIDGPPDQPLRFDVSVLNQAYRIQFETDPPDAPVSFDLRITPGDRGVYLGPGVPVASGEMIDLGRSDPRLAGALDRSRRPEPGVYIRAVARPVTRGGRTQLSDETLEHLRELGYIDAGESRRAPE